MKRIGYFAAAMAACLAGTAAGWSFLDPAPSWPPRAADVNGRKLELFSHGAKPEWGYASEQENQFAVVHPAKDADAAGRPLVVVLHSAGHSLATVLRCARHRDDHDVYLTPDDTYALYLDCRYNSGTDWWWGAQNGLGSFDLSPCEKRVLDTVKWVKERYRIDPNRVYLCGNSMGASGTLGIGLRNGDVFAAVKAYCPAHIDHASCRMGFDPYRAPEAARFPRGTLIPDPPVCVDLSAQNDNWATNHERFVCGMMRDRMPLMLYWGVFGHANADSAVMACNDIVNDFDWLSVRRNEPYPVFTRATSDNPLPWPVAYAADGKTPLDRRPGQVNGFFRWKCRRCDADGIEIDLWLARPKSKFPELAPPAKAVATVTVRRTGAYAANGPDHRFTWCFGDQRGSAVCLARYPVVEGLEIMQEPKTLIIRPEKKTKSAMSVCAR